MIAPARGMIKIALNAQVLYFTVNAFLKNWHPITYHIALDYREIQVRQKTLATEVSQV